MTIKQLGGVFGRNPTFNDVTIEGELTFDGDIDINSDLKISGDLEVGNNVLYVDESTGNVGINTDSPNLHGWTKALTVNTDNNTAIELSRNGTKKAAIALQGDDRIQITSFEADPVQLRTANTDRLVVSGTGSGDVTVSTGNLVIGTSGKGIDFSATSGAGTSELFDDYEEGTWTPTYSFSGGGTVTTATNGGLYVKIGRMVYVSGALRSTAVSGISGSCSINGLPYACEDASGSAGSISIGYARSWGSDMPNLRGWIGGTATSISLYKNATNAGGSAVTSSEFDTGANNNVVEFIGVYRTSS